MSLSAGQGSTEEEPAMPSGDGRDPEERLHQAREAAAVARGHAQLAERALRRDPATGQERALRSLYAVRRAVDRLWTLIDRDT